MLDKNNYISFDKLYKSVKEVAYYDRLTHEYNQMSFHSLVFGCFGEYVLSHYDYDKSSLVINQVNVFTHMDDNTYYVSNKKGKLTIKSVNDENDYINSVVFQNEDVFNKMINSYEDFREFHTEHLKDAFIICDDGNFDLCLDLDNYKVAFKKKVNDSSWNTFSYIRYYRGTKSIEGSRDRVQFIKDNESAYTKHWIKIDRRVLPNWANNAVNYYESTHKNIFSKLVDKLVSKKQPVSLIDIDSTKKVHVSKDELYDRVKIDNDVLFKRVDDHFEINEEYVNDLKYIDLNSVDFKDVLVSGIDFTDTNINFFDPQTVYKKDLSYCRFGDIDMKDNDIPFSHYTDFNGVNLCGTVIFGDSDFKFNLNGAITDNNTKIIHDHSALKYKKKK